MSIDTLAYTEQLKSELGDAVTFDPDAMLGYRHDQSLLTPAGMPLALVRARTIDDVVATLTVATSHRIPVVTRAQEQDWQAQRTHWTGASCLVSSVWLPSWTSTSNPVRPQCNQV